MKTLIVEDEAGTRRGLEQSIKDLGGDPRSVGTVAEAAKVLEEFSPHVLLIDINLPDGDGLEILRKARQDHPDLDAVVITGSASLDHAIEALRAGATDYLLKPLRPAQLEVVFQRIAERRRIEVELDTVRSALQETGRLGDMVGRSEAMQKVFELMRRVARSEAPVLLTGPSGSGKEVAARTIHRLSRRGGKAFVAFNCGAVSPTLIESELFGHERGSFTGADRRRVGYFEEANSGTLFLDEITEMSADLQVRLLRVLEERTIRRVGGSQDIPLDVRLLSATNREPPEAIEEGKLREDLYYRLNVFPLALPPLKDRRDDIPLLAEHFRRQIDEEEKKGIRAWDPKALECLQSLEWPGNVRELRNVVHRAYIMTEGDTIMLSALDEVLPGGPTEACDPDEPVRPKPVKPVKPIKPAKTAKPSDPAARKPARRAAKR
jgi:two-component system response regulator AtoC